MSTDPLSIEERNGSAPDPSEAINGEVWYSVPVVVTIEDGEITSVRVYDEAITLDERNPGPNADEPPALIEVAETGDWPAWVIG